VARLIIPAADSAAQIVGDPAIFQGSRGIRGNGCGVYLVTLLHGQRV
jgi:hypothetical protein